METSLLVLAGGIGSRFGGVKQVEAVGPRGETILEYSIYDALQVGFSEILFLIRSSIEADFRERILSRLPSGLPYRLVYQELDSLVGPIAGGRTKPWGTGHALLCAEAALNGADRCFAVVNADDYYGRGSLGLVHDFLGRTDPLGSDWCMAGYKLRNTTSAHGSVSRGLCRADARGRLLSVLEHTRIEELDTSFVSIQPDGSSMSLDAEDLVSMNLWGFSPRVFPLALPLFRSFLEREANSPKAEFYLPGFVDQLVAEGRASVEILETEDSWFGLTYREDLDIARARIAALVERGFYPSPLWRA
jgi:hypothetical protein